MIPFFDPLREGISKEIVFMLVWKISIKIKIIETQYNMIDILNRIVGKITSRLNRKNSVESFLKKYGKFKMRTIVEIINKFKFKTLNWVLGFLDK